jgi:methionine-rich copper-binding protein CopC
MRKQLVALVIAGTAIAGLAAPAAHAEETTTTFVLSAGTIAVAPPASVNLTASQSISASSSNATLTGQLGNVVVSDNRGALVATWNVTVDGSDFTTGAGGANRTIVDDNISYWSGAATASSGIVTAAPGQPLAVNAQSLDATRTAMQGTLAVGVNSVTWNPTLVITVPASNVAGTYSGTITHSLA